MRNDINFVRSMGLFALTMTGVSSIIGSGWLFSAYYAAQLAGPAAIFCWIIGGAVVSIIALTVCEIGGILTKAGGMARYLDFTHGSLAGFLSAWANWLGVVAVVPIEAMASIQYMSSFPWAWAQNLFDPVSKNLTTTGMIGAVLLLVMYFLVNYWSLKLFIRFISSITLLKVIIPIMTGVAIIYSGFHPENFTSVGGTILPYGWAPVLSAIVTCGIVMSFNGFQSPVNFAEEAKNPHFNIPLAVILSIVLTLGIYLLLQVAFIGAISPDLLAQVGWHGVNFKSPLVQLALLFNLNFIVLLLYFNSVVSPSGTGMIYMATTARMLYGMERNNYMPKFLGALNPKYKIPRNALVVNLLVSFLFLWFYRGWAHLVALISIAHIVAYIPGPVCLGGLRRVAPGVKRVFKLPLANLFSIVALSVISFLFYWTRWPLTGEVVGYLFLSLVIYLYYQHKQGWASFAKHVKASIWLFVYLIGLALISFCGGKDFGGIGLISSVWAHVVLVAFSAVIYVWACREAWMTPLLANIMKEKEDV
jgi:amino acid transporter